MQSIQDLVTAWREQSAKLKIQACHSVIPRQSTAQLNDAWAREECAEQLETALKELEAAKCQQSHS